MGKSRQGSIQAVDFGWLVGMAKGADLQGFRAALFLARAPAVRLFSSSVENKPGLPGNAFPINNLPAGLSSSGKRCVSRTAAKKPARWRAPEADSPRGHQPLILVAWGGIEPPTRGFSIEICVRFVTDYRRNNQQNQSLSPHRTAVKRSRPHLNPDAIARTLPEIFIRPGTRFSHLIEV
jgi:hypothetical protein